MSIYAMADLHLSENANKPMDVFGSRWQGYTEKIKKNWSAVIKDEDCVIVPGDISWAASLSEALPDFKLIDSLPGTKYIGKGNHDYWWQTSAKLNKFFADNDLKTIKLLYNNAYDLGEIIITGSRGWYIEERLQNTVNETDYNLVVNREVGRLRIGLLEALKLKEGSNKQIVVFTHFPPVYKDFVCEPIIDTLKEFNIQKCYFGHLHSNYLDPSSIDYEGIRFEIISSDYLNFVPKLIFK